MFSFILGANDFENYEHFPFIGTLKKSISFIQLQEGDFEMKHIDKAGSPTFNVAIAPFSLSILGDGSDAF